MKRTKTLTLYLCCIIIAMKSCSNLPTHTSGQELSNTSRVHKTSVIINTRLLEHINDVELKLEAIVW